MNIIILTIPHKMQRYDTAGDWQWNGPNLTITVSQMPDTRYMELVAVHELIEALLCGYHGISSDDVDKFDMPWQPHDGIEEPGDDPAAPYHREHEIAESFEEQLMAHLRVTTAEYDAALEAL